LGPIGARLKGETGSGTPQGPAGPAWSSSRSGSDAGGRATGGPETATGGPETEAGGPETEAGGPETTTGGPETATGGEGGDTGAAAARSSKSNP
jgi:hypothetical protein